MRILIIIPVLNEEKNINLIWNKINKLRFIKKDILFIDDNSKDDTQIKILNLKKKNKNIFLLRRSLKKVLVQHIKRELFGVIKKNTQ